MRKAIEKAIASGFNLSQFILGASAINELRIKNWQCSHASISLQLTCVGEDFGKNISFYHLIFGTDFIDKLVGEGSLCVFALPDNMCSVGNDAYCNRCVLYPSDMTSPDYHRSEMANIKDIEKLKEYIKKLGE